MAEHARIAMAISTDASPVDTHPVDPSPIDGALGRLDTALLRLEAAVGRRLESDAEPDDRDAELAIMDEDRARLAAALDAASARLAEMEVTTGAVGHRLDRAIGAVEDMLGRS